MSAASMKEIKVDYRSDPVTSLPVLDIFNEYQTDNLEVIKSKILIRLGTAKGEWLDDLDFGIPLDALHQNSTDSDITAQLIADEILKVENVLSVQLVNKTVNEALRTFTAMFNVNTVFGQTNIEVSP